MIFGCRYSKGSLIPRSLDVFLKEASWQPLPPLKEFAFPSYVKSNLVSTLANLHYFDSDISWDVLNLYQMCSAIRFDNFVLGSMKSRHKTASVVVVNTITSSEPKVAEVQYYLQFHVKVNSSNGTETRSFWFAAVSLFLEHPCRVWFGSPTEVWSRVTSRDILLLPLSHILCRTAYVSTSVNFGRVIGEDTVLVVVPLSNDMTFSFV